VVPGLAAVEVGRGLDRLEAATRVLAPPQVADPVPGREHVRHPAAGREGDRDPLEAVRGRLQRQR
jgi:hypothetical protein